MNQQTYCNPLRSGVAKQVMLINEDPPNIGDIYLNTPYMVSNMLYVAMIPWPTVIMYISPYKQPITPLR